MTNIRELYNDFTIKLHEYAYTIGAKKRIQIMLDHMLVRPSDIVLYIGGNYGKNNRSLL